MNVRTESYEYESAWALGPNSGHPTATRSR